MIHYSPLYLTIKGYSDLMVQANLALLLKMSEFSSIHPNLLQIFTTKASSSHILSEKTKHGCLSTWQNKGIRFRIAQVSGNNNGQGLFTMS
jgi:hypothetical protein